MKREVMLIFSLIIISLLIGEALAITGSIGNSRMILRLETGEKIEKYVLVRNVNEESVDISISTTGDLKDYVELKEEKFTLGPGEEKKAYFTIYSPEKGSSETKINIAFTPEEGHGVGLSSTVIVVAEGESQVSFLNWISGDNREEEETQEQGTPVTGAFAGINAASAGMLVTTFILIIFIILLVAYSQKISKKRRNKLKKSVKKSE
jgi:hypothetical protein